MMAEGATCFNATAAGGLHRGGGQGCQDASFSQALPGGGYLVVVADGHGDKTFTRSDVGARLAVDAARSVLAEQYARLGDDLFSCDSSELQKSIAQAVVAEWRASVERHLNQHRLRSDECGVLALGGGRRTAEYLYGTTLVAALIAARGCLMLQQGDGCCVLLGGEGQYWRPLPEDERCVGNKTSSLADADAASRMRLVVLGPATDVACCLLATDGISKSFADDQGLFDFFDWVLLAADEAPAGEFGAWLQAQFEATGAQGASDDLSLAGVVCRPLEASLVACVTQRRQRYQLAAEVAEAQARLVSLERKHQRLAALWETGGAAAAPDYPRIHDLYLALQERVAANKALLDDGVTTDG